MPSNTLNEVLAGCEFGDAQSVGIMDLVPIITESPDEGWAAPSFDGGTSNYSQVRARNLDPERPTIFPTGGGFITRQEAQDHASGSAFLIGPGENALLENCVCIQETQGGLIQQGREDTELIVLPASLRTIALGQRGGGDLGRTWGPIKTFNSSCGVDGYAGDLVNFLNKHRERLDQFVAQFELVPNQVGAIVALNGHIVGIERSPNEAFWGSLWEPLIRTCYGSLAIQQHMTNRKLPGSSVMPTRMPMQLKVKSLRGIRAAMEAARLVSSKSIGEVIDQLRLLELTASPNADHRRANSGVFTTASTDQQFAGQVVVSSDRDGSFPYLSLCSSLTAQ